MNITIETLAADRAGLSVGDIVFTVEAAGRQVSGNLFERDGKTFVHAVESFGDADDFVGAQDFFGCIENSEIALLAHIASVLSRPAVVEYDYE